MEQIPNFLIALGLIPVVGFATVWLVMRMVGGEIDALPGLAGLFVLLLLACVAVFVPEQRMAGPVFVTLVASMAFFPFAETHLEKHEMVGVDCSRLDRAHRELSLRPDNLTARFELARALHDLGLYGHAIALAENTLGGISSQVDAMTLQSLRDKFRAEGYELAQWKRQLTDPKAFDPVQCPSCGFMNPPGVLKCGQCAGPYLLELARVKSGSGKVYGRLTLGFALTAVLVVGCAWVGASLSWPASVLGIGGIVAAVGALMTWIYRPRTLRD